MKNRILYIALVLISILFFACKDFLSDPQPTDQLPIEEVFQTGNDLETALAGVYDLIQNGEVMGANIPALADVMANNGVGWFEEVSGLQMEADHWLSERLWVRAYRAINQANAILDALPDVIARDATLSAGDADRIEGEALFIRGVLYFELVRLFALPYGHDPEKDPGVPVLTSPILDKESLQFPSRNSVKEVYDQATSDLEIARDKLPETQVRGRATSFAAIGYLARISFQKGDHDLAANLANEILGRDDLFGLTSTPQEFFSNEGSQEEIWVIFGSQENDPIVGGLSSVYNDAPFTASITTDLRDNGFGAILSPAQKSEVQNAGYRAVDLRCDPDSLFLKSDFLVTDDTTRCNKYENGWKGGEDDTPTARLAEFKLMRAEALAGILGINTESIDLLNEIRARSLRVIDADGNIVAGAESFFEFEPEDFQHGEDLIEAIILERRVELAFEGNYLHDLMRLKKDVLNGNQVYPYDAPKLRLPIPQREIDVNPNLEQNPGYF